MNNKIAVIKMKDEISDQHHNWHIDLRLFGMSNMKGPRLNEVVQEERIDIAINPLHESKQKNNAVYKPSILLPLEEVCSLFALTLTNIRCTPIITACICTVGLPLKHASTGQMKFRLKEESGAVIPQLVQQSMRTCFIVHEQKRKVWNH
ncbi:hypothetical protein PROFUN_01419 [Planoprotostelium fungivorum]|uniref:Uncharacterized protein n=1 Tax=Planoprotostelium fungivorum TaxID=1890364 RepID=A0A2P6NT61_9EUKA|nr:hypothetical protein PROFUN_01419 [Planoprotostelium fungivorum]